MTKPKNILFIVSRLPINLATGDRVRVYNFIQGLTERGHQVDIIGYVPDHPYPVRTDIYELCTQCIGVEKKALEFKNPDRIQQLKAFAESLFQGIPYRVWQWNDTTFVGEVAKLVEENDYEVIHFSSPATAMAFEKVKKVNRQSLLVFDFIDAFSRKLNNAVQRNFSLLNPFRWLDSKRLKTFEQSIVRRADRSVIISENDKKYIGLDDISVIPNGITDRGQAADDSTTDVDLLFTGNMATEPNIDAVQWFVRQVMPALSRWNDSTKLYIAGINPPSSVQKLESDQVTVTGFVKDLDALYQQSKIFVCPMRLGAGQKNKILEAMVNRCPVISTGEGNLGINAPAKALAIANTPKEFVTSIKDLLTNQTKRTEMAEAGYQFARTNFSWDRSIDLLEQCYEQ